MKNKLSKTLIRWAVLLPIVAAPYVGRADVGQIAEDFELPFFDANTTYSQTTFKLSEHKGKVIVLEWFGWWCPFCPPAARAFQDQVLRSVGSQNSHGVPVEHVVLHVNGVDNQGIADFMTNFALEAVVMDDRRTVFNRFHRASIQPFFVIINAVEGSPTSQQWEVLYEHDGFGGPAFPGNEMVRVINSVEAGTPAMDPGNNTDAPTLKPTAVPTMSEVQPYADMAVVAQLKDTSTSTVDPSGLGFIYDANFPNVYSFSLAEKQRREIAAMSIVAGSDTPETIGWFYVSPDFTELHRGILAYDYYLKQWVWFAPGSDGKLQVLDNRYRGEGGWEQLPTPVEVEIPASTEIEAFLSALTVPSIPEGLSNTNPFELTPTVGNDGRKDLNALGFAQLGMVDDRDFPLISSDKLGLNQSGTNAGWAYVLTQASSVETGILAYLYEGNQWVWFPKSAALWYFGFAFPDQGFSGWNRSMVTTPTAPSLEELEAFAQLSVPSHTEPLASLGAGNPFAAIATVDGVKNSTELGDFNLGWIDDSQYPFVYSYDLAEAFEGEDAGWIYLPDNATVIAGGVLAYFYGNGAWHWIPAGLGGLSMNLSQPTTGISGWNQYPSEGVLPTMEERVAHGSQAVPETIPEQGTAIEPVSTFAQLPIVEGIKNSQIDPRLGWGLGWIDDRNFPMVYSYDQARLQIETATVDGLTTTQPKENAGWYYVLNVVSGSNSGALLYSYAAQQWEWIPANGTGRSFNLNNPQASDDGWFRLLN